MIVRAPHLQDDVLYECYYATRRGEPLDPPAAEHLSDCDACGHRYADVGAFLNQLDDDDDADVNALFPPERLRQQQQEIAKRLELVGRAARVISFPSRPHAVVGPKARPSATRWVAAAAAAGLFVGVAAGTAFNFVPGFNFVNSPRHSQLVATHAARSAPTSALPSHLSQPPVAKAADIVDTDDRFMSDLESVLDRPHTSELVAFDALTPHVREIRDFAR